MERSARISTGESVAFEYELAGLGSRFIAVLVDLAIQIVAFALILIAFGFLASFTSGKTIVGHVPVGKLAQAVTIALVSALAFIIFFGYFIVLEWRFGRTPGKAAMGLRVVRDGGFPLDFTASAVRNIVRILEAGVAFYTLSAISTLLSPYNRRLGDYAAGTLVVRDNRFERDSVPVYRERPEDAVVASLTQTERELILQYASRRDSLVATSRDALAARIALPIRPKLAASFAHLGDDDLLVHLATTAL
jgi:uncharacterized RDD family membrane protein YckC